MKIAFELFQVDQGWMGLVGNEKGVQRIYLPGLKREDLQNRIFSEFPGCEEGAGFLNKAKEQVAGYFSGRRIQFDFPLDLSGATSFQRTVYKAMRTIPYGEVRTYRWVAKKIGKTKAWRAVGGACAKNRWPLAVPCHRVVGSDGRLTGFSASGGLALKEELLKVEGMHPLPFSLNGLP